MGYYGMARGDYYRGDYYRGDPGFFSSLGNIVGGIARTAANLLPGPVGAVARTAINVISQPRTGVAPVNSTPLATALPGPGMSMVPAGFGITPVGSPVSLEQYGRGAFPVQPGMFGPDMGGSGGPYGQVVLGSSAGMSVCKTKGYHLNRSGYYRRTPGGGVAYIEKNSACVRNRRMNPANGHALRRALRRASAFKKMAMKSIRLLDAGRKPKKFGGFKTRRK